MLNYNPQHVSSSTLLIFRRINCIITASGIVILCKRPYSMPLSTVNTLTYLPIYLSLDVQYVEEHLNPRKLGSQCERCEVQHVAY